jgi:hypothetical protein
MQRTETFPTYVIASVEPQALNGVLAQLKTLQGIKYYSPTTGRFDITIQLAVMTPAEAYRVVQQIRALQGVLTTRTFTPIDGFVNGKNLVADTPFAFVLLNVHGQMDKVLQSLHKLEQVQSAYVVPGEFDILATVYGTDYNEIIQQVWKIAELQGIERSETLFAIKPHWA